MSTAMMMDIDSAKDLIDTYGADSDLWPLQHRDELEELIREDEDFKDYVEDIKRIDDMLSEWDDSGDPNGVDVGEDTDDDGWGGIDEDEDDEEIEIDPDMLKDMDEMFSDAIKEALTESDVDEFRVFTRDYDELVEIKGVTDQTSIEPIDREVSKAVGPLMKDLRRMIAARSQVRRIPGKRRGRLHAPNLHRVLSGDDRVFTRREEAQSMDTAISLVIDCSGSMQGQEMILSAQTAYALGSVLNKLGIQFECLGFTDNYQDPRVRTPEYVREVEEAHKIAPVTRTIPLTMPKFKAFDERWAGPVQRRFAHVHNNNGYNCGINMGGTPEGCGMEFAARRLLQRNEERKIMIVMTDGSPGSHAHGGGWTGRGRYYQQSVDMVQMIEAAGIDLVGIGICHNGPAAYYTNHMCIDQLEDMPKQLMALLKRFLVG